MPEITEITVEPSSQMSGDCCKEKEALQMKEEGNKRFASADFAGAVKYYSKALKICPEKSPDKVTYYKNRSAAYLKINEPEKALNDATAAVDLAPSDVKALFRRCQAYEALERFDEAFKDARTIHLLEPKNGAIQPLLRQLTVKLQEIAKEQASLGSRVKKMLNLLIDESASAENRNQAANNLIVLSREKAGSDIIMRENGLSIMFNAMKKDKQGEVSLACIRVLGELCKSNPERTVQVLEVVGIPFLIDNIDTNDDQYLNAVQFMIQTAINSLSGLDMKEGKKPDKVLKQVHEKRIDSILLILTKTASSRIMSAKGRDAILELIMKNVDYEALNWGMKLVDSDGLSSLLAIASELQDIKYESSMAITGNTRTHVSVTLDRVYYCMDHDKAREKFREKVMEFVNCYLRGPDIESKVRVTAVITSLLQGPLDVGNFCIGQQGVVEMMLAMAGSDDELQQKVAAEAIIAAASKKDKCTSIVSLGTSILKKLYQSKNDNIKIRALVGLCKLGSVGGFDASIRPFAEGSTLKLGSACRKFLINPAKDRDLRKWATEGLSYLTLDADVKEELIEDKAALLALIELAKAGDLSVVYGVVTTLVNLTNSYDKEDVFPELKKLAKFAKQHVPEEHPKDDAEFVNRRVKILGELGVTIALVALSTTESKNSKEMMSRVFNAICEQKELRGIVVQQGGTKALLKFALEGTDKGKNIAAQALARIAITINPEVAFPGQRCVEVVRPIMSLLHQDCSGLQNFEALMALTNLGQVSPSVRKAILKDNGLTRIEQYMYEDHEMIKRAATQCLVNIILDDYVIKIYESPGDRVKYLVILSEDDDLETAKAAAGALAMITEVSTEACKKCFDATHWLEILCKLTASEDKELAHRGVYILHNLIASSKENAEKIIETDLFKLLMAITMPQVDDIPKKVKELAKEALQKAEEWKIISQTESTDQNPQLSNKCET